MVRTRTQSSAIPFCAASERESAFFNQVATESGDFNPFTDHGWATLSRRFEEMVRPSAPLKVLDIGCGTGQSRQIYIRHSSRYVGVDLAELAIDVARQRYPSSEWHVGDARTLPFPDNSFDVVTYSSVLHHIPDFSPALVEGRRVLRPGGAVFAFDPNVLHPAMALFRHPSSPLYIAKGVSPDERPLRPSALRQVFEEAGFKSIQQRCQADIPYRRVAPRLINAFLRLYNLCDWLLEKSGLARWFGTFVLTCGRKGESSPGRPGVPALQWQGRRPGRPGRLPAGAGRGPGVGHIVLKATQQASP